MNEKLRTHLNAKIAKAHAYIARNFPAGRERIIALRLFASAELDKSNDDRERAAWKKLIAKCEEREQGYLDEHKRRMEDPK